MNSVSFVRVSVNKSKTIVFEKKKGKVMDFTHPH